MKQVMYFILVVACFLNGSTLPESIQDKKKTQEKLDKALSWLARHQNEDGSWSIEGCVKRCGEFKKKGDCNPASGDSEYDIGCTGLVLLAFLSGGYTPKSAKKIDDVKIGEIIEKGITFITDNQNKNGRIGNESDHFMYNHLISGLVLTEIYAITKDAKYKEPAQQAVDYTVSAQNEGVAGKLGWRYTVKPGDNDSSTTGWAAKLLRSADNAKLKFPKESWEGIKKWFASVTDGETGIVGYDRKWSSKYPLGAVIRGLNGKDKFEIQPAVTAIAISTFLPQKPAEDSKLTGKEIDKVKKLIKDLGSDNAETRDKATDELIDMGSKITDLVKPYAKDKDPEVSSRIQSILEKVETGLKEYGEFSKKGVAKMLADHLPRWKSNDERIAADFYYTLFGTLVVCSLYKKDSVERKKWLEAVEKELLSRQNLDKDSCKEGSWEPEDRWACKSGRVGVTTMGALILEILNGSPRVLGHDLK